MKLAFCLFKYFPFGGLQRDFYGMACECLARGYQVDIYTMHWQGDVPKGFHVTLIKPRGWTNHRRYWSFAQKVMLFLQKKRYDLVIGFNKMPYLDLYYAADLCYAMMAHRMRTGLYRCSARYRYFMRMEQAVFSTASKTQILYLSERQKQDIIDYYHTQENRLHLLSPWIAKNRLVSDATEKIRQQLRQEFAVSEGQIMLLMIGSGFKTKGLDRALFAIAALPKNIRHRVKFFVIGQDKANAYIRLATRLGIIEQMQMLGGRSDVPRFLFAADLLIHPARNENAGIVLLEAVVAGLPVLTTEVCGYACYVKDAKMGIVLPSPFEQAHLNTRLHELLSVQSRQTYIKKAMNYNKTHHFFDMPEKVVDYLESCHSAVYHQYQNQLLIRADLAKKWKEGDFFSNVLALTGKIYRELDGRRTLRFEYNGCAYFAKIHYGVGWREVFKNLLQFRCPVVGAKREWLAIERLHQLNIDTMQWVAYGSRGYNPATRKSFIITEELPDSVSLEQFCLKWREEKPLYALKTALLHRVATVARKLHHHGLNHRDFYICHFLLNINSLNPHNRYRDLQLFLIDLHRVQQRNIIPKRWLIKDIGSLYYSVMQIGLTQRDILRFLKIYFNKSLRRILAEEAMFLRQVKKRGAELYYKAYKSYPRLSTE
jgi:UDP-glucose:(heptosyl)LPS alpha-1,3-glucosyltransferase